MSVLPLLLPFMPSLLLSLFFSLTLRAWLTWVVIYIQCGVQRSGTLTSHLSGGFDGQHFLSVTAVLLVKPCSVFCLSVQAPASVCQCHISWPCHVFWRRREIRRRGEKKKPLPKWKVQRSYRRVIPAPTGAAELSRRYEGKEMETNAFWG